MTPKIITLDEKKLVGQNLSMSMTHNRTFELWKNFMPLRHQIKNKINSDFISMQAYAPSYNVLQYKPDEVFEKWATVEVSDFSAVPENMESFVLPAGLYAVFTHKGPASAGPQVFQYIFGTWLPNSDYTLDKRPHFEILGNKYKNEDPDSEEDIYIPICLKQA